MNKKHRHLLALLLCFVMTVSLFAGYSETKAASEETTQSEEQTETQETGETREITDMAYCPGSRRYRICFFDRPGCCNFYVYGCT